ncbi:MAG: secretion protein F [Clostridia bacterium]|nr:secretion protein F [Clostridia bacterium]
MLKVLIGILTGIAAYFLLADVFKIPYVKTSRAVGNLAKKQQEKTSSLDVWLGNFASFLAKHMPMNEFRKQELAADLKTAQMDVTPEMYTANAIVKSLLVGVFAIPVYFIFPILCPVVLFLAFILYRMNIRSVSVRIGNKRAKIEADLPRLVATIEEKLKYQRSIKILLTDFARNARPELKHELEITVADIHSGNEEAAVTRLESRVGSPMMSDVCRGLVTLIHGDVAANYWENLVMKFEDINRQRLKAEAQKAPRKVKRLSMCLLFCFMLVYVVVIVAQIMNSVGVMFSG